MRQTHVQNGFTLIEVLLTVALMAIIMALAYGGLRASTRAASNGEARIEKTQNMRMAHQFVRRQLNQVLPLAFITDDQGKIVFEGDSGQIMYVGPMPGYLGYGGLQLQSLELAQGDSGQELRLRHMPLAAIDETLLDSVEPLRLLDKIEHGQFEFLFMDEDGLAQWTSSWDQVDLVPDAVRLTIEMREDAKVQFPQLVASTVVALRAEQLSRGSYEEAMRSLMGRRQDKTQ